MRILVTGAGGLIGAALTSHLTSRGHRVDRLVRRPPRDAGEFRWDPASGRIDAAALEGGDGAVHLAGEPLDAGRWSAARKRSIRESRVTGTRHFAAALARLARPPAVLVSVSAIGIYGDRGDETLDERSAPGAGFLGTVAQEWEGAAEPARARGIRVVHPRIGLVLSPRGGVLGRLLPIFRLGLGGPIGRGRAWWSWIAIDDLVAILERALQDPALSGVVNAVAPHPVRNREFARTLGHVLGRPALLPVPPPALRLLYGEMADAAILASLRVTPAVLAAAGHRFLHPELEGALRGLLDRPAGNGRATSRP